MSTPTPNIQKLLNDPARLAVVKSILDTNQEINDEYDRFTRLAARMFNASIAVFCVMDQDQEHKKSTYGWDPNNEMIVERAKCHQAFLGKQFTFEHENKFFFRYSA